MKYSPRIIHFSASPKPSDFLFGQDYHHLHDRTLSQRSQERPPVVKWVENVEHVYAAEVIEPQKNGMTGICGDTVGRARWTYVSGAIILYGKTRSILVISAKIILHGSGAISP